jgi:hypothetical protein
LGAPDPLSVRPSAAPGFGTPGFPGLLAGLGGAASFAGGAALASFAALAMVAARLGAATPRSVG